MSSPGEDVDFLASVYNILKCIERESSDSSAKRTEESSQKVLDLQKKFETVREQIRALPGIDYSKEDQLLKLESLRKQLVMKKELLQKYKNMGALEGMNMKQYTG